MGQVSANAEYVGSNLDGRLEVFALSPDETTLFHVWQTEPNNGWSPWGPFPNVSGGPFSAPAGASNADGRLEVFLVSERITGPTGSGGDLLHIWQTEPNNGWSPWGSLLQPDSAQLIGYPVTVKNAQGYLEVFVMGDDGNLYHIFQTAPGGWSNWESLGNAAGVAGTPAAVLDSSGQVRVFTIGTDGNLYYKVPTANAQWVTLGNPGVPFELNPGKSQLVQLNANGQLEAFAVGNDGNVYHTRETTPGEWSAWTSLGNPGVPIGYRTTARTADGRLVVFILGDADVVGGDGNLWYTWQMTPNGEFGGWEPLGRPGQAAYLASTPAVGTNADGRLEVFVVYLYAFLDSVYFPTHIWQTDFVGGWSPWGDL